MTVPKQQQPTPQFALANNELVPIPDCLFTYSAFLREYKKAMLGDAKNFIIPLATIPPGNQPVLKQHLNIIDQFFNLYTRHNYGAGSSSAKKASSALELHKAFNLINIGVPKGAFGGRLQTNKHVDGVELAGSGTDLREMEAKADAKTPGLPDWAHGFFSALDKDLLIGAANIANFLSDTQFVEHLANFFALRCREMDSPREIMEFLNYNNEDVEGDQLRQMLYNENDKEDNINNSEDSIPDGPKSTLTNDGSGSGRSRDGDDEADEDTQTRTGSSI